MSAICRMRRSRRRPSRRTRVAALRTHAYPGPSIKLPPRMALSLGARLTIVGREGDFAISADGLHIFARHLAESGAREPDYVAVAERFLETPYLWGGRTSEGIDCSGLVQTALAAAGQASPRDSDMQEAALGEPVAIDDPRRRSARRSRVLEGACRDHARFRHAAARQRLAHEGRERAARRSAQADRRQRRRRCDERAELRWQRRCHNRETPLPRERGRGEGTNPMLSERRQFARAFASKRPRLRRTFFGRNCAPRAFTARNFARQVPSRPISR